MDYKISNINITFCNKYLLVWLLLLLSINIFGQKPQNLLSKADELFEKKKYTDALGIYEKIFAEEKQASVAMLHKLAFIHEGLNNYTETLYYLSFYNDYNPDNENLKHMEDIAHEHRLKGYTHSDFDFVLVFYRHYNLYILIFISCLSFYLIFRVIQQRNKRRKTPKFIFPIIIFLCAIIFFSFSFTQNRRKAIIFEDQVIIMDSPSAGGKVIDVINKGHRLEVKDKIDIWYEVIWEDEVAYIRENNLKLVGFRPL